MQKTFKRDLTSLAKIFSSIRQFISQNKIDESVSFTVSLVVEEIFPLSCSLEEMDDFLQQSDDRVEGWISHYFGRTIEEHAAGAEPAGEPVAKFLEYWRAEGASRRSKQ